jgi:hypothetical protein
MESAALDATPSGCLFSTWIETAGVSKSTAYQWRAALGIKPEKRRIGTRVEVWLSADDLSLLDAYRHALGRGLPVSDALALLGRSSPMESDGAGAIVPMESTGISRTDPMESDGFHAASPMESDGARQLEQLRTRLAALRDAVELGAPLTTAEVSALLGARPGGAEVVRGRLRAVREARNCWTIEPD